MPLDALCLAGVVHELDSALAGAKIDKIYQPGRDEVILGLRSPAQGSVKLLLSANQSHPRAQLTALPRENPAGPPMFCMLLRKHLSGGVIESVRQELAADWQSEAVAFVGEGVYSGETVLWFTIEMPEKTQYKAAVCRVLENGRYRLTKIENPSTYCSDIVSYLAVYLVNNPDCRTIITKGSTFDGEI